MSPPLHFPTPRMRSDTNKLIEWSTQWNPTGPTSNVIIASAMVDRSEGVYGSWVTHYTVFHNFLLLFYFITFKLYFVIKGYRHWFHY